MLSNLAENLHSSAKWKNKQAAKIWGRQLKKQRFGDTMQFPEGLENTPFKAVLALPKTACSAQTQKSLSFIWIVWSTLYVNLCLKVE